MKNAVTFWGAGRFSCALASCIDHKNFSVYMWSRRQFSIPSFCPFVRPLTSIEEAVNSSDVWIFCIPAQALRICLKYITQISSVKPRIVVLACKGIEKETGNLMPEVVDCFFPFASQVVIAGPNFASELVMGYPSGTTCASKSKQSFDTVAGFFSPSCLKIEYSNALYSISAWSALKNIAAIGCGVLAQVTSSKNAQATYLCNAFSQSVQWILAHILESGEEDRLSSSFTYAGIGDFFMTCTSENSRNFSYGKHFGGDYTGEPSALTDLAEGVDSLHGVLVRNKHHHLELNFAQAIEKILNGTVEKKHWVQTLLHMV